MSYDIDADKMMEVMRIGREKLVDKGTTSANKRVDPLKSQTQMPRLEIIDSFMRHFQRRYDTELSDYTEAELETARNLVEKKFDTKEWRSEEHTSELQSRGHLVCRLLLEK